MGRKATPATIAVSVPDFKKKRRDIAIYVVLLLNDVGWAEILLFLKLVGQAFPKGLRDAVYFNLGQSASKDFFNEPTENLHSHKGKHSIGKEFL